MYSTLTYLCTHSKDCSEEFQLVLEHLVSYLEPDVPLHISDMKDLSNLKFKFHNNYCYIPVGSTSSSLSTRKIQTPGHSILLVNGSHPVVIE